MEPSAKPTQLTIVDKLTDMIRGAQDAYVSGRRLRASLPDPDRFWHDIEPLVHDMVEQSGAYPNDAYRITLTGLLTSTRSADVNRIVREILAILSAKFRTNPDFRGFSWDELKASLNVTDEEFALVDRILVCGGLMSGAGGSFKSSPEGTSFVEKFWWGCPESIEDVVNMTSAAELIAYNKNTKQSSEKLAGSAKPQRPNAVETPTGKDCTMQTKTRTILFMDVKGWSKLTAHEIHAYATKALPELAKVLIDCDFVNTWGDAIVASFDSAKNAAESALRIRDFFEKSYPEAGIATGLTCRISMHLGEVICCDNSLRGGPDIFGEAVHIAARLEPVTVPGTVFCTDAVASRLSEVAGSAPRAWPLGEVELAKSFGAKLVYVVTGPNATDPRPGLRLSTDESKPVQNTNPPSDEVASVRIRGWVNKLPLDRSGEAIPLREIAESCRVTTEQLHRLIRGLVDERESWVIEGLTGEDVIFKYPYPSPVMSRSPLDGF